MHIVLVGTNHKACPLEVRERLAFRPEQLPDAYRILRQELGCEESLILSTCNRVEIYAGTTRPPQTLERLASFLHAHAGFTLHEAKPSLYQLSEPHSVGHLFAVASGLDSMVLGETEILHQVKHAYELARAHGMTGKTFNILFQKALNAAKSVRAQTAINQGAVSIGTVAIELAQKIFGDLRPYTVLLAGAGKIGELVLKRLMDRGITKVCIANRSVDRAQTLALAYGAQAFGLGELQAQLARADIVMTCVAVPGFILSKADVAAVMPSRRQRPLCLIDLGVPSNIDPSIGQLENVYLFDLDDLQGLIAHHHQRRQQAVEQSREILNQKVERFLQWWSKEHGPCASSSSALEAVR